MWERAGVNLLYFMDIGYDLAADLLELLWLRHRLHKSAFDPRRKPSVRFWFLSVPAGVRRYAFRHSLFASLRAYHLPQRTNHRADRRQNMNEENVGEHISMSPSLVHQEAP